MSKRILKEAEDLAKDSVFEEGIIFMLNKEEPRHLICYIEGVEESIYKDHFLRVEIFLPDSFPN